MTTEQYKESIARSTDLAEIDNLSFLWLYQLCEDHGDNGHTAKELLKIAQELLED